MAIPAEAQPPSSHWPISVLSSLSAMINVALPLALTRILSPEEVGSFKVFFLYVTILPAFSLTSGIFNGFFYWAGYQDKRQAALRSSSLLVLALAAAFAAALFLGRGFLPMASARGAAWSAEQGLVFSVAIFGAIAAPFFEEAMISTGAIWKGSLFSASFELARTGALLSVALATRRLDAILVTHSAIILCKTALGYALGLRRGLVSARLDREALAGVLRYSLPVSLAWAFGVFTSYADQLILSTRLPTDQFAFYTIGCLSVPPLLILEHSVAKVLIPALSRSFAENTGEGAALYRKAVDELAYIMIPAVAGMIVFATPIIELLFTPAYAQAARYLPLFALTYLLLIILPDSVQRARGQARWILANLVVFSVFALALCYALSARFGAFGALTGLLLSKAAMRAYSVAYVRKSTGWPLASFLPFRAIALYAALALALAAACIAARPLFATGLGWFLSTGPAFTVAYFALSFSLRRRGGHGAASVTGAPSRALLLTQLLGLGGLERMILNLAVQLKEHGFHPSVLVFDHDPATPPEQHLIGAFEGAGIPVKALVKPPGFSVRTALAVRRALLEGSIDVLHTHDLGALIYGVCARFLTLRRIRLVHTQHSFVYLSQHWRYRLYARFFTLFVDRLVAVSEDTRKSYVGLGIPERRIHLVPNGVTFAAAPSGNGDRKSRLRGELNRAIADSSTREALAAATGEPWVLYMARLHGGKGQDHAIRLWTELDPAVRSRVRLLFVGSETQPGFLGQLRALIEKAPDSHRIHYAGPSKTPMLWLGASDIYVSCSEFEGMPLGPIEAAGSGLPILLSRIEGHRFLERHGKQYPLENPGEGAALLKELVAEVEAQGASTLLELWNRAEEVRSRFSLEAMARRYEALYL